MDGEVESFELRDLEWVLDKIVNGGPEGYKPNCNLVVIDFLVRYAKQLLSHLLFIYMCICLCICKCKYK